MSIQEFSWYSMRLAKPLGVWGLLGVALFCASLLMYGTVINSLDEETMAMQTALTQKPLKLGLTDTAALQVTSPVMSPDMALPTAQTLQQLYQTFPFESSLPRLLAQLNQMASQQHLVLNSGDYRLKKVKQTSKTSDAQLVQYEIVFPIKGRYLAIRLFVAEALARLPTLAIDTLQISRENTLSPEVEARLVLVLFVKEAA